jgi:peptide/nickel transport system permease protein
MSTGIAARPPITQDPATGPEVSRSRWVGRVAGPATFIGQKLLTALATLWGLATVVFIMTKLIPGDQAAVVAGESATPEQVATVRADLGLDEPLVKQYFHYLGRLAHGDLGISSSTRQPVLDDLMLRVPGTIELVLLSIVIAVSVAVPLAILAAARAGGGFDKVSRVGAILAFGLPGFWLALILQWLLGSQLGLLPISGRLSNGIDVPRVTGATLVDSLLAGNAAAFSNAFQHLILPACVLAIAVGAQLFRTLRTDLIRVASKDYIRVAKAKGVHPRRIWRAHVLPNAAGPLLTMIGIEIGMLMGSAILVESVFGLSGVGDYLSNAVDRRDIGAVVGSVTVIGVVVIVANLIVDIVQLAHDPRLRTRRKAQ